ncbi:MAG: NAD(P)H-hydrate epimerase, partial [Candidatus Heimdallarchaeota archaeon]
MVITSEEVRIIDENSEELGLSVLQLMENAGAAGARVAVKEFPNAELIAVCCGTGNNGGDGMVLARHLVSMNKRVRLFLVGHKSKIRSQAALTNFNILTQLEHSIEIIIISDSSLIKTLKEKLSDVDLIIDSLLGIGLTDEPYEPIKSAIITINNTGKPIFSVDLPSGMWSDIPKKTKLMINADKIATFHDTKPCLTIKGLQEKTTICSIGVPPEAELFVGKGDLRAAFPKRKTDSHKGENGMVL